MGVIDIRAKGGTLPEPKGDDHKRTPLDKDPIDDLEQTIMRADKLKLFRKAAGFDQSETHPPVQEKLDVGSVVKALAEQNTQLMTKVAELMVGRPSDSQSPLLQYLTEELKEAKEDLRSMDPFEALTQTQQRYSAMLAQMKKDLGLPESMKANMSDAPMMLELERIKLEREDRQRQFEITREESNKKWDLEMLDRKRRWEIEDRRWEAEFQIRKQELEKSAETKNRAFGELSDLAQALVAGIAEEKAKVAGQPPVAPAMIQQHIPLQPPAEKPSPGANYRCDGCGAALYVPPNIPGFDCPKCGKPHEMQTEE